MRRRLPSRNPARWGVTAFAASAFGLPALAQSTPAGLGPLSTPTLGGLDDVALAGPVLPPQNLGGFAINIIPGVTLSGNAPALAAFNRAADQWESFIADPITVTVNADLLNLGSPTIIGSASSVLLTSPYDTMRGQMVLDGADEADDGITAFLPTAAQFGAFAPQGATLSGSMLGTKANLKALGYPGLDGTFGLSDGTISFNSTFNFDFDNSNGVTPGFVDFETVAAHEIGHVLGFISSVDTADTGGTLLRLTPWDLFRFRDDEPLSDPATPAEFTTKGRDLVPGQSHVFDDVVTEGLLSTGVNLGDGNQASHWKDDGLTSNYLGIMDPTLPGGIVEPITYLDLRVLDLIGYEITPASEVPEASTSLSVLGAAALAGGWLRRRATPRHA